MNRNGNEAESFAGNFVASDRWRLFFEVPLFLVPTISFRLLYGFLILQHTRRKLLWLGVAAHPSAEWIALQLTEGYGWQQAPRYIIRDRIAPMAMPFSADFEPWVSEIA